MANDLRPRRADWIAGLAVGALLGVALLGVGGRMGMRLIALGQGQAPSFTLEGTLAVISLGAAAGAAMAAIFLIARTLFPGHRTARVALFWIVVGAIVLRGLHPLSVRSALVFMPLFVVHGCLLFGYWCRVRMRTIGPLGVSGGGAVPDGARLRR